MSAKVYPTFRNQPALIGKALPASAINRTVARLVGIPMGFSGMLAIAIAAAIGNILRRLSQPIGRKKKKQRCEKDKAQLRSDPGHATR